ncbi:conserved hypothetical protein [Candidatus Zixiibacteriota bacterium]|nr:conserved hypothetical protein [candidate division Zixibacteria bacterium]
MKYAVTLPGDSGTIFRRTVMIGMPPGTEPFISAASGSGVIMLPDEAPGKCLSDSRGLANIAAVKVIRGHKVAVVEIHPYFQEMLYKQIDVSISFQGNIADSRWASLKEGTAPFDRILDYAVLNYAQAREWVDQPAQTAAKVMANPFAPADTWYKIGINGQGMVKITGQNLISAGAPSNITSDNIHLFYGGGRPLPVSNDVPRPDFREIPLIVQDGGDGILNSGDYFSFYGEPADRWTYPSDSTPQFIHNPYTGTNYYWLAVSGNFDQGGLRIGTQDGSLAGSPDTTITQTKIYIHSETNRLLLHTNDGSINDYYNWYWTDQNQFTFFVSLSHAVGSAMADVRIHAKAGGAGVLVNDYSAIAGQAGNGDYWFSSDRGYDGLNKITLSMTSNYDSPPYLDFCEIGYRSNLVPAGDQIDFSVVDSSGGRAEMAVANQFSAVPSIYDISDPSRPVQITGAVVGTNDIRFQYPLQATKRARFFFCPQSRTVTAMSITKTARPTLMDSPAQTDLFIIAPNEFIPSLENYRAYRADQSGVTVKLVSLEEIINQFSYGLYDPTAIRDYLKFAYDNYPSPRPSAVLLVGDGNYDFENNLQTPTRNLIPPYIMANDSTASDDNYVYFGSYGLLDGDTSYAVSDRGYDMMISRWPVRNAAELNTVIDKIESYESSTNFGPWRATVTLVADDEFGNFDGEAFHTTQTEELQKYHLPTAFRRNKIYLWDYPFDSNRQKPLVNQAIIRSINDGTLVVNYVGHGNPDTWAHEHVFNRNTDLPQLHNADKLTLIFTASCSIGFFDDPTREGMAEDLLRLSGGGAVGTVAATRLVYAGENADFNQQVYDILFGGDSLSICQSIYTAKLLRQYESGQPRPIRNDRSYEYFGDPFMKLGIPKNTVQFEHHPDSLLAMSRHQVEGTIKSGNGDPAGLNGVLDIYVYDSDIQKSHRVLNQSGQTVEVVNYALAGPVIFRGKADITDDNFQFSFIAPLDIGYGGQGAKISGYAIGASSDGFGLVDSLPVSPLIAENDDSAGPSIVYTFGTRKNFVSGDKIASGEELTLRLSDPSGINLTGGSGHGISLVYDGEIGSMVNLTDLFEYDEGSYTSGRINYALGNVTPGEHRFKVKVWDNANNSSVAEFGAEVVPEGQFVVSNLLNYPNPMRSQTTFSFELTSPAKRVSLEIFTLSGRKIMAFEKDMISEDYHEFCTWNGRDADGDRVASGVYIYKLTALSAESGNVVESYGKVVVVN